MINKEVVVIKSKDKINNAKKMLTKDYRYSSSLLINNHNKSSSKTFLPKIKQNRNSCININSISTKIIIRPNIKKINNYNKNKQENQKFHENNSKNNNSMILNEKSSIKTSYDFAKKGKSESKVKIPNSIIKIDDYAFEKCYSLKNFKLCKKLKTINKNAFLGCKKLKKITIPKSVKKIGKKAFGYKSYSKKIKGFTIKGYKGTAAEKYAKKNKFKFVPLD